MRYGSLLVLLCVLGCASAPKMVVVPPGTIPLEAPEPPPETPVPVDEFATLMTAEGPAIPARATGKRVGSMLLYTYQNPAQVFPIKTAVHQGTTVLWPAGEQIRYAEGAESVMVQKEGEEKVEGWSVVPRVSGMGVQERQGLVITPRAPNLRTTVSVFTSRRMYLLELISTQKEYQPLIGFYAEPSMVVQKPSKQPTIRTTGRLGVGYDILAPEGRIPFWAPVQVWDDTRVTIFRFAPGVWVREMPALYSLTSGKEPVRQLVNYTPYGIYLIGHRLAEGWELKLGDIVVQIRQRSDYAQVQCPEAPGCPGGVQTERR